MLALALSMSVTSCNKNEYDDDFDEQKTKKETEVSSNSDSDDDDAKNTKKEDKNSNSKKDNRKNMSGDEYLEYLFSDTADLSSALETALNKSTETVAAKGSIKLSLGNGLKSFLEELDASEYYEFISWLKNANINFETNVKDFGLMNFAANIGLNNTNIASLDMTLDMENGAIYMSIPEVSAKTIYAEIPDYDYDFTEIMSATTNLIPDAETLTEIINCYSEIILENLSDVEKDDDKLKCGKISQDATKLTIALDTEDFYNICHDVLKKASKDKSIEKIVEKFAEFIFNANPDNYYDDVDSMMDDYRESIQNALEDIEATDIDEMDDIDINLELWTNAQDELIGIAIQNDSDEIFKYVYVNNGKNFALSLNVNEEEYVSGSGTVSGNKLSGDISISSDYYDICSIELENFQLSDGILSGAATVTLSEDLIAYLDMPEFFNDCTFKLEFESNAKKSSKESIALTVLYNNKDVATLSITAEETNYKNVTVPNNALDFSDTDAIQTYVESLSLNKIISNLKKAGMIDELVNTVQQVQDMLESEF